MYKSYYGFADRPFCLSPDPEAFFSSATHGKGLAYMHYGLEQGEGFVVITGTPGTGKTTLLNTLLSDLPSNNYLIAKITNTLLDIDDIVRNIAVSFGVKVDGLGRSDIFKSLETHLCRQANIGKRALLLIDEAHNLSPKTLEELRLFSNFQFRDKYILQIFLVGQSQLEKILSMPDMLQLRQRVLVSHRLEPISVNEIKKYLEHRLRKAGWSGEPVFSHEACQLIHWYSEGIPRQINTLAERILLYAALEELINIDKAVVKAVVEELKQEPASYVHGREIFEPATFIDEEAQKEFSFNTEVTAVEAPVEEKPTVNHSVEKTEIHNARTTNVVALRTSNTVRGLRDRENQPILALNSQAVLKVEQEVLDVPEVDNDIIDEENSYEKEKGSELDNNHELLEPPAIDTSFSPYPLEKSEQDFFRLTERLGAWLDDVAHRRILGGAVVAVVAVFVLIVVGGIGLFFPKQHEVNDIRHSDIAAFEPLTQPPIVSEPVEQLSPSVDITSVPKDDKEMARETMSQQSQSVEENIVKEAPGIKDEIAESGKIEKVDGISKPVHQDKSEANVASHKSAGDNTRPMDKAVTGIAKSNTIKAESETKIVSRDVSKVAKSKPVPAETSIAREQSKPKIGKAVTQAKVVSADKPSAPKPEKSKAKNDPVKNTTPVNMQIAMVSAASQVDTASKPKADVIPQQKLDDLMLQFRESYSKGDLKKFSTLFSDKVVSNETEDLTALRSEYNRLFDVTEKRNIEFEQLRWERENDVAHGKGEFVLGVTERGATKENVYKGTIELDVNLASQDEQITRIVYSYDK